MTAKDNAYDKTVLQSRKENELLWSQMKKMQKMKTAAYKI